ncbi:MAG: glutathione S-transferase N-terminal domain-containing protein [Lautropia sp.]
MKLITVPASPFGRKVRVVAAETGLTDALEVLHDNPWKPDTGVPALNPVGKVPVLVTDDGTTLYDSTVICEFLDSLHQREPLFPARGVARWRALRRQQLADHALDAFILARLERNRAPAEQSPGWIARQQAVLGRCLDAMDAERSEPATQGFDIGDIAIAVCLGHLDFRQASDAPGWRDARPRLAAWYERVAARASLRDTMPHD